MNEERSVMIIYEASVDGRRSQGSSMKSWLEQVNPILQSGRQESEVCMVRCMNMNEARRGYRVVWRFIICRETS